MMHLLQTRMRKFLSHSRILFAIALPAMLQSLVEYVFIFTDTAFVGHYDPNGLSAINNVMAPFFAILSIFYALTQGITILLSQKIGAKKIADARRLVETAFFFMFIFSVSLGLFWIISGRQILSLMGAQDRVLDIGTTYVQVLSLHFISLGVGATASCAFQAMGRTLPIMISAIIKCVLNVFLNWIFIYGIFGMPGLGVTGSALGTVISNVLLDSVLVYLLVRRNIKFRVRLKGVLKPRIVFFSSILKLGVPVGAEFILWSIGQAAIISMINRIDNVSSGWFGAIIVLTNLAIQLYSGIGTATLVLIGQATGANRHREVLPISMYGMAYAQFSCLLVGILFLIIPDALLSLFIPNPESRQILQPMMGYAALIMFFKALNIISGNSIRGTGNTLWMLYTQIGGTILIIIVAALFIFNLNMGLAGLLLALVADEGTRGVINLIKFLLSQKKYRILKSFEFVH